MSLKTTVNNLAEATEVYLEVDELRYRLRLISSKLEILAGEAMLYHDAAEALAELREV